MADLHNINRWRVRVELVTAVEVNVLPGHRCDALEILCCHGAVGGKTRLGSVLFVHYEDIIHPLKEVDAPVMTWAKTPEQVVEILKYLMLAR